MEYSSLIELGAVSFTLLLAFPNLFINLDNRKKEAWILNFYEFIATKLLIPSLAYLASVFLVLSYYYSGVEHLAQLGLELILVTTLSFLVFILVGLVYSAIRVMIDRSIEKKVLESGKKTP